MKPWYRARTLQLLGDAIAGARADSDINQQDLAALINSSRPTISRLESGNGASAKVVLAALQACGYELIAVPRGAKVSVTAPEPPPQSAQQHQPQPQPQRPQQQQSQTQGQQ